MELLSPGIVLASYAESLFDGRRAVVFGDSTSPLAEEMIGRGARSVHVCDPEPARAGESALRNRSRQISVVPLDEADVAVRQGAFDVAIIEDLSIAADAGALLAAVRRALSPRGVAFIASPNADAKRPLLPRTSGSSATTSLGYYELYDKVAAEFPEVRMLGQTPFVGYAIVDFAPATELDVELDSGFLPTGAEEPEWFVAVAARGPVELGAFNIVQLPASRVVGAGTDALLAEELRASRASETRLVEKLAAVESENARLQSDRQINKAEAGNRAEELRAEVEARDGRIVDLEARKAAAETALEQATAEVATLRARAAGADQLQAEHASLQAERDRLVRALEEAKAEAEGTSEKETDVAKLEGLLAERAERIRKLESDLAEAERIGKELVKELAREVAAGEGATAPSDRAEKLEQLSRMAAENANLRAEVQALEWTVQELENRLDHAARRVPDTGPAERPRGETEEPQAEPDVAR